MTSYSTAYVAIVIIAKIMGLISIVGSSFILHDLFRNNRIKLRSTKNRIILCLSISDIISSLFLHVIGTWFVPKGLVYGSLGNITTCEVQGYIGFLSAFMGAGFNASLSIAYILVARYQWKRDRMKKATPYLICIPIVIGVVVCTMALIYDSINWGGGWTCELGGFPVGCDYVNSKVECERGSRAGGFLLAGFITVSVYFFIIAGSMLLLFWTVFKQEKANKKFNFRGSIATKKHSKPVAVQGILYVVAFLLSHALHWIETILSHVFDNSASDVLLILIVITAPLQGLFNALVYFRPTYLESRRKKKQKTLKNKFAGEHTQNIANAETTLRPEVHDDSSTSQICEVNIETARLSSSLP